MSQPTIPEGKMKSILKPLVVLFGCKTEDGSMVFLGRTGEVFVRDYIDELIRVLRYCNGYLSLDEVREKSKLGNDELFDALMEMCLDQGIVRDSRELMFAFHDDSSNPMRFSNDLSPSDIEELVERKRVIPDGPVYSCPELPTSNVLDILQSRKSVRTFSGTKVDERLLFGILKSMYVIGEKRSTPSAGKLYPLNIYVVISSDNQSLSRGVYFYDPLSVSLVLTSTAVTEEKLSRALDLSNVPGGFTIFVTADVMIGAAKYANRSYRYALLEAGHAVQNAYMFVAEQGEVGILEFGGFDDAVSSKLLNLDSHRSLVLTTIIGGNVGSADSQIDQSTGSKLWRLRNSIVGEGKPVEWDVQSSLGQDEYVLDKVLAVASYAPPNKAGQKSGLENHSYGLSTDSRVASIKAIAEAYERHVSGLVRWDQVGSANRINCEWLDPRVFTPFDARQYQLLNRLKPFDPDEVYQWVEGRRYNSANPVLVPVEHVFYPVSSTVLGRLPSYISSSSGVAAHFDYETALERAMLELIERDAVSVMWYGKRSVGKLADELLPNSVRSRKEKWERLGWQVNLLDITTDSVPVVLALITSDSHYPHAVSGASAAFSFDIAVGRALEEAEVMLTSWRFANRRPPISAEEVVRTLDHGLIYFQPENLHQLNWLREASVSEPTRVQPVDILSHFNPIIVDLVRSVDDSELSVVRVLSEKLLPINFGYGCEHYRHPRLEMLGFSWARVYPSFPHLFA